MPCYFYGPVLHNTLYSISQIIHKSLTGVTPQSKVGTITERWKCGWIKNRPARIFTVYGDTM